ncbi:MAG: metallophosphoesterase [Phycisphaerae bacterium]|nr:metallophosphoesterase [Phycisphaerae bacterium]
MSVVTGETTETQEEIDMLTVIHLSDLHIHKSRAKPDNKNADMLVNHLIRRFKPRGNDRTYVVLTGDLTDDGDLRQYRQLQVRILEPLAKDFTLLPVPGNHDYAKYGNVLHTSSVARFAQYVRQEHQKGAGGLSYPCVTVDQRDRAVFIGLDSADPQGIAWFAEGVVGPKQSAALADVLAAPEHQDRLKVVYLHHHPFDRRITLKLQQADALLGVLERRADVVLFGHKHKHEAFFNWYHVPLMLASGKVTEPAGGNALAFRVLEISEGKLTRVHSEEIPPA